MASAVWVQILDEVVWISFCANKIWERYLSNYSSLNLWKNSRTVLLKLVWAPYQGERKFWIHTSGIPFKDWTFVTHCSLRRRERERERERESTESVLLVHLDDDGGDDDNPIRFADND